VVLSESDQFKRKKKERKKKKVLHFLKLCQKATKGHESLKCEQKFFLKVRRVGQVDQFLNNSLGGTSFDLHHKKSSLRVGSVRKSSSLGLTSFFDAASGFIAFFSSNIGSIKVLSKGANT